MENSSFVPNPLSSPALMVLASTAAEGREAPRLPAPPHPFSPGQSMDKDLPAHPPPPGFVYRPGEPFPSPLYAPLPPFVRPGLERGLGLLGPNSGAFRHLGPHEGVEPYHSAFTPAKKSKSEDVSSTSVFSSSDHQEGEGGSRKSVSPSVKEERPSSISSLGDTNSEVLSDHGDLNDRGTPDSEGRALRRHRKRAVEGGGGQPCCPVCGLTLRPGETDAHLSAEVDKLDRIFRGERKCRESGSCGGKNLPSPSGRKGKDSPSPEVASRSRYESYMQIRAKRQSRLHARSRNRKRREETACPICSIRLTGTPEELNGHVELCLKKRQGEGEEEAVDVEGEGGEEQYRWGGISGIPGTSNRLPGPLAAAGYQTWKKTAEDDMDLNVDGDDSEEYGRPQFTEKDLIPLGSSDEDGRDRLTLRRAVLEKIAPRGPLSADPGEPSTSGAQSDLPLDLCQSDSASGGAQSTVAAALAARVQELSDDSMEDKQKCLICMKAYDNPLVSIQCWHVLCEKCWFHTLGAKKLCPQCNTITAPSQLRRIYL